MERKRNRNGANCDGRSTSEAFGVYIEASNQHLTKAGSHKIFNKRHEK